MTDIHAAKSPIAGFGRTRLWWEIALVLALSVGRSALYSVLSLVQALTREQALGDQSTSLNPGANAQQFWDVLYQFLGQFFALAPIALALYFLWEPGMSAFRRIGLDFRVFGRDIGAGILLVAIFQDRDEQTVLGTDVVQHARHGQPAAVGDVLHREAPETPLGDQFRGHLEDLTATLGGG